MSKNNDLIICNYCGKANESDAITCNNCHNELEKTVSIDKSKVEKTKERLLYELENKVIMRENYKNELSLCIEKQINNNLTRYLILKNEKKYDFDFLLSDLTYKNMIINDILRSDWYTEEEKKVILNDLSLKNVVNKEVINGILDESIYKLDKNIDLKEDLFKEKIEIVQNEKAKPKDLYELKIVIGLSLIVILFLFTLFFTKELGEPTAIILSIIPSIILGLTIPKKIKVNKFVQILIQITLVIFLFIVISYLECIRFDGIISIKEHINHIINAIPNFIEELFNRLEPIDELNEEK